MNNYHLLRVGMVSGTRSHAVAMDNLQEWDQGTLLIF